MGLVFPWGFFLGGGGGILSSKAVEEIVIGKVETPLPAFLKYARKTARSPQAYTADYLIGLSLFDGVSTLVYSHSVEILMFDPTGCGKSVFILYSRIR